MTDRIIMYFILRSDLISKLNWPLGAVFTQVAHAASACIWTFKDDQYVLEYMRDIENMHKVTLKIEGEESINNEAKRLSDANIDHRVWVEDGMPVCIAVKPQPRISLKKYLGHLSLYN